MYRNFLFYDATYVFFAAGNSTNQAEHGTIHRVGTFQSNTNSGFGVVYLTNSLLISVTNNIVYQGTNVVTSLDDSGFFQTVGSGERYLINNSTNRDVGTTNINPTLAADLKKLTTYPPVVLTNHFTNSTTLTPQAQRDTDTPDLGYHYDCLDFVVSQIAVTNATLTLQAGTALGVYGASNTIGLVLLDGAKVISEGTADNLNRIVRYNLVQEQASANWSAASVGRSISTPLPYATNLLPTEARFRFTEWSMPAAGNDHFYAGATNFTLNFQDCQFRGGQFTSVQPNITVLNTLFERMQVKLDASINPFAALVRNCTVFGGSVTAQDNVGCSWGFTNNLFDTTNFVQTGTIGNNYNAYLTNSARLTPNGASDRLLSVANITYDTGPLGRFYLPTNLASQGVLFNSGNTNADLLGLYHYTTTTNQMKETNSLVDIGFHYVAVNSSGQPIDSDGDGLQDYVEDMDGDGTKDSGETGWLSAATDADTDGDGVSDYLEVLLGRSPLVAGSTNDFNGTLNLRVYTPLK